MRNFSAVKYNFMRKHQIAKEKSDTPLSMLIQENQNKAARDLMKTQQRKVKLEEERKRL